MRRGAMRATMLAAALAVLLPLAAEAADRASCREYAEAAIRQVRGGINHPRCQPGMQGARWSADEAVHYNWCLAASDAAIGAERNARTAYLRSCM